MKEIGDIEKNENGEDSGGVGLWGGLAAVLQGAATGALESTEREGMATAVDAVSVAAGVVLTYASDKPALRQVGAGLGYSGLGSLARRHGGPVLGFLLPRKKPAELPASARISHEAAQPPRTTNNFTSKPDAHSAEG
jgi:hypothetical protein